MLRLARKVKLHSTTVNIEKTNWTIIWSFRFDLTVTITLLIAKRKKYLYINIGFFPFDETFQLEFPEISREEWNKIFWNFKKGSATLRVIPKFSESTYRELPFHLTFVPEFPKFSVEWFPFRKFNSFQIFWKLSQEISLLFVWVSKFSDFWWNGKRLLIARPVDNKKLLKTPR